MIFIQNNQFQKQEKPNLASMSVESPENFFFFEVFNLLDLQEITIYEVCVLPAFEKVFSFYQK